MALLFRKPQEYKEYFKNPNIGASETGVSQGYWLIEQACPGIKTVVVRRPLEESVQSLLDLDLSGVASYDKELLTRHLSYSDRMLSEISNRPDVLTVGYSDLNKMETCKRIFEHCLPYPFDVKHYGNLKNKNIQIDMRQMLSYYHKNKEDIHEFKRLCKIELIRLRRGGLIG